MTTTPDQDQHTTRPGARASAASGGARTFSHAALAVGRGEGPLAARLLGHLGCEVTDNGPSATGEPWYTAVIDAPTYEGHLVHLGFYVSPVSDEQLALEEAVSARCGDLQAALWSAKRERVESHGHLAIAYRSLEDLEAAVAAVRSDPALASRVEVHTTRPQAAPRELEARLDASEVFADATRVRYLADGVQAFVVTDVVSAGLLCAGQSFELNHRVQVA